MQLKQQQVNQLWAMFLLKLLHLHPTVFQLFLYGHPFWPLFLIKSPSTNLTTIPITNFSFPSFSFFFFLFLFFFFCSFPFSFPFSESWTAAQRANYDIILNDDIVSSFRFRHWRCCKDFTFGWRRWSQGDLLDVLLTNPQHRAKVNLPIATRIHHLESIKTLWTCMKLDQKLVETS